MASERHQGPARAPAFRVIRELNGPGPTRQSGRFAVTGRPAERYARPAADLKPAAEGRSAAPIGFRRIRGGNIAQALELLVTAGKARCIAAYRDAAAAGGRLRSGMRPSRNRLPFGEVTPA